MLKPILIAASLLTTLHAADPKPLFWSAADLSKVDRQMEAGMDATKGSHIDLMPTTESWFMTTYREATAASAEVHQKLGELRRGPQRRRSHSDGR